MIIKICGLTRPEDAALAVKEGADFVGMITGVPESPRNNPPERLGELLKAAQGSTAALLTRNMPLAELSRILGNHAFGCAHLCGNEDRAYREKLRKAFPGLKIWQTVGVPADNPNDKAWISALRKTMEDKTVDQAVLDSSRKGLSGGVGIPFPHREAAAAMGELCRKIVLAGGISPENAEKAIAAIRPRGVDASSGIESRPGVKDPDRMRRLIKIVKNPA